MAEQRTTNASGVRLASDEHSLTVGPARVPTWIVERGEIGRYAYNLHAENDDFGRAETLVQAGLDDSERDRMVSNIVGRVSQDVSDDVQAA